MDKSQKVFHFLLKSQKKIENYSPVHQEPDCNLLPFFGDLSQSEKHSELSHLYEFATV